jgi:hypothetical protein
VTTDVADVLKVHETSTSHLLKITSGTLEVLLKRLASLSGIVHKGFDGISGTIEIFLESQASSHLVHLVKHVEVLSLWHWLLEVHETFTNHLSEITSGTFEVFPKCLASLFDIIEKFFAGVYNKVFAGISRNW